MFKKVKHSVTIFLLFACGYTLQASHIRAGEIIAEQLSQNNFRLTLYIYRDTDGISADPSVLFEYSNGDQQTVNKQPGSTFIGNDTEVIRYVTTKTFNSGLHTVSIQIPNRNASIVNIPNSQNVPFSVQTSFVVNPFLGTNNPAVFQVPPIDQGTVNQIYTHNPGIFDPDGDSIAYRLITPRMDLNLPIPGYTLPGPSLTMDAQTGDLVWDRPTSPGEYNIAYVVEEWRNGILYNATVRDMQIIIDDTINAVPELIIPNDTCIVAGSILQDTIYATDADGNQVNLTAISGVFNLVTAPLATATTGSPNPQVSPASLNFEWQTSCDHVREQPYQVVFRAEESQPSGLTELVKMESWLIYIKAPPVTGLSLTPQNGFMELNWDPYVCSNAFEIDIWRRSCGPAAFVPDTCGIFDPALYGYEKIGEVSAGDTSFIDDNDGLGLSQGINYCYVLTVRFDGPAYGTSVPTSEVCAGLDATLPIVSNVTVTNTDSINGAIDIVWSAADTTGLSGPYSYELYRSSGVGTTNFSLIYTTSVMSDTSYSDNGLNTLDSGYTYRVAFLHSGATLAGNSDPASSVYLTTTPADGAVNLSWEYSVPWVNNTDSLYHLIYSDSSGTFEPIDSVLATGTPVTYTVQGLANCDTFCFYVETRGRYCLNTLPDIITNNSQISCEIPRPDVQPPTPFLIVNNNFCDTVPCNVQSGPVYQNELIWSTPPASCGGIESYNVYYAPHDDEKLQLLVSTNDTSFIHDLTNTMAGCYRVEAVNAFGQVSEKSNKVCVDNCPCYELPNIITPNFDGKNDYLVPFPYPRFVESVTFRLYNRWGKEVYVSTDDININWGATHEGGLDNSDGIYYYSAKVKTTRLRKSEEVIYIKGWVEVIR